MSKYKDDLLFFLFYTNVGDAMQLAAAVELYVNLKIIEIHSTAKWAIYFMDFVCVGIIEIGGIMRKRKCGSHASQVYYRIMKSMDKPNEAPFTTSIHKHGEEYQKISKSIHPNWKSVPI